MPQPTLQDIENVSSAGEALCPEDAATAAAVNRYLAEELARACRYNKSHNCFTADLQAFKCSQHVDDAIKKGLQGFDTYAKVWPDNGSHIVTCWLVMRTCHVCSPPLLAFHERCRLCSYTCHR